MIAPALFERIVRGEAVGPFDLLPAFAGGSVAERVENCASLALALLRSDDSERRMLGREFARRAWETSGFDAALIPLMRWSHERFDDFEGLRAAWKRAGMAAVSRGDVDGAIRFFDAWQNGEGTSLRCLDDYKYDFDVLEAVERVVAPHRVPVAVQHPVEGRRIRVAYLVKGFVDVNSVLVRIVADLVRHHDRDRFDLLVVTPERSSDIASSPHGTGLIARLESDQCRIVSVPEGTGPMAAALFLAVAVREFCADVLYAVCPLADFTHYATCALRPAPVLVSMLQGAVAQFTSPLFDHSISWFVHPMMDCPVESSLIPLEVDLPDLSMVVPRPRRELGVSDGEVLLLVGGRTQKLQNRWFWESLVRILRDGPSCRLVVLGTEATYVRCFEEVVPPEVRGRVSFLGWTSDYQAIVASADVVIDTYPTSGGAFALDVQALGVPLVAHDNDYLRCHDAAATSASLEYCPVRELVVPRGDRDRLVDTVLALASDPERRRRLGAAGAESVRARSGSPSRMTHRVEDVLRRLVENASDDEEGLARRKAAQKAGVCRAVLAVLRAETADAWSKVPERAAIAGMGDHRSWFYAPRLAETGLFDDIARSRTFLEFGPGTGAFLAPCIREFREKIFLLVDVSEAAVRRLYGEFKPDPNVGILLDETGRLPFEGVDAAFSFLVCQMTPRSLWAEHLMEVHRVLLPGGSYVFQFACRDGVSPANDSVPASTAGSQMYDPEVMETMVRDAGFESVRLVGPIDLSALKTDVVWYLCRAEKTA